MLINTCCFWFLGEFGHLTVFPPGFQDAPRSVPSSSTAPSCACVREDSWRSASRRCFKGERPAAANQEPSIPIKEKKNSQSESRYARRRVHVLSADRGVSSGQNILMTSEMSDINTQNHQTINL